MLLLQYIPEDSHLPTKLSCYTVYQNILPLYRHLYASFILPSFKVRTGDLEDSDHDERALARPSSFRRWTLTRTLFRNQWYLCTQSAAASLDLLPKQIHFAIQIDIYYRITHRSDIMSCAGEFPIRRHQLGRGWARAHGLRSRRRRIAFRTQRFQRLA